ncbi:MAG: MFS transporter [Chloroflexota bacterium]|nr:MFS transporter [Chloroflexota bacterium]
MPPPAARAALPRRLPFYYGWVIVAGFFLAGFAAGGPMVFGFSIFIVPMEQELGWSRATLLFPLTLGLVLLTVLSPLLQPLMDRRGWPPIVLTASSILLGVGMILNSRVQEPWQFIVSFGLVSGAGFAAGGGFAHLALVPKWFVRMRARAIAIGSMGTAVSAMVYPLFAEVAINAFGWRTAWVAVGVSSLALLIPISLLMRRAPEDAGLLPDGDTPEKAPERASAAASTAGGAGAQEERSYTPREAARHRTTWLIVGVMVLTAPTLVGLTSNWAAHFRDIGLSSATAAGAVTTYGTFSLLSRFVWGFLVERYHVRPVSIAQALMTALALLTLLFVQNGPMALAYGALQGITLGGALALQPLIWANYYGRRHLGAILGAFQPFASAAMAVSPAGIGLLRDRLGAYEAVFAALLMMWLLAALLLYLARPLPRPGGGAG